MGVNILERDTKSYAWSCDCGADVRIDHPGPTTSKDVAILRGRCGACGRLSFAIAQGADAYSMRDDTFQLQAGILNIFHEQEPPMTVRQVYYQCTVKGLIPKTEAGYNKVQSQLTAMRRAGSIPYGWIADTSRTVFRSQLYGDLGDALTRMQNYYRRDLWRDQRAHVQMWVEKKALIGVLWPVCQEYGVPLFPCGGFSSISFVYEAAQELQEIDKPIYIYHLGDFDADGVFAAQALRDELITQGAVVHFERLGLHWWQVEGYGLPTRPQKQTSTRFRWFKEHYGDLPACELDALPPVELRQLVRDAIESHINPVEWANTLRIEAEERKSLAMLAANGWEVHP